MTLCIMKKTIKGLNGLFSFYTPLHSRIIRPIAATLI